MNLKQFLEVTEFHSKKEIERVKLLAFFHYTYDQDYEFNVDDISNLLVDLGFPRPNKSRLKKNIINSRDFIKSNKNNCFRLHAKVIAKLQDTYSSIGIESEEIETINTILPESLYIDQRSYIVSLAKQINASYENNIFDGCAVLMRRLLEVLLIHSYEENNIESEIKYNSDDYKKLSDIINNAKTNSKLSLSRNTKQCLDDFRTLGNFSAHKIYYTAKRKDIDRIIINYRATIEELLYKSKFKK